LSFSGGNRAEQDRDVVEQPVRPGELEERIDEDHGEPDRLDFPGKPRGGRAEGERREHIEHLVRRPQDRERAADRKQRGRGEEGRAADQRRHHLRVDDARLAMQHALHPHQPVLVHQLVQALRLFRHVFDVRGVTRPSGDEPGKRDQVEGRESHGGTLLSRDRTQKPVPAFTGCA
jgi:hypothetical protein